MKANNYIKILILTTVISHVVTLKLENKKECINDETESTDDPNNYFPCNEGTTCCRENGEPSCCVVKPFDAVKTEQITLWCSIAGLVLILAIVMFCCRHDGDYCCNRKDGGRYKYCCCGPVMYRDGKSPINNDLEY